MHNQSQKGIAILMAVIAVSAMLLIATAISDIAYKQQIITSFSRDTKVASYAANAGVECALFHDFGGGVNGTFLFASTTVSADSGPVFCAGQSWASNTNRDGATVETSFYFNIATTPASCSVVTVSKNISGSILGTKIESSGYNSTCDTSKPPEAPVLEGNPARTLERTYLMTYCTASVCPSF